MAESRQEQRDETSCVVPIASTAASNAVAFTPSPLRGFTHDELPTAHFWLRAYLTHVTWRGVADPHSIDSGIGAGILRNRGINCAVALLRAATATTAPRAAGLSALQEASQ